MSTENDKTAESIAQIKRLMESEDDPYGLFVCACSILSARGIRPDTVDVCNELALAGKLSQAGGVAFVIKCFEIADKSAVELEAMQMRSQIRMVK